MPGTNHESSSSTRLYDDIPLQDARTFIRLFDLLPAVSRGAKINGRLRAAELDLQFDNFEALSYVWGSKQGSQTIQINGSYEFPVSPNLHAALRRLRRKFRIRTLWVDAICIDQDNIARDGEKSHQVGTMGKIYRSARRVNVWLGESEIARSRHFRPLFRDHSSILDYFISGVFLSDVSWTFDRLMLFERFKEGDSTNPPIASLWHSRVWTTQEFCMAKRATFILGSACIKLNFNGAALNFTDDLRQAQITYTIAGRCGLVPAHCEALRTKLRAGRGHWIYSSLPRKYPHLYSIANVFQNVLLATGVGASDERDKIYSLLSLVNIDEAEQIHADYSQEMTPERVFTLATYTSMQSCGILEILRHVTFRSSRHPSLPSWSLDFTGIETWAAPESLGRNPGYLEPWHRDDAMLELNKPIVFDASCGELTFSGYAFDVVDQVYSVQNNGVDSDDPPGSTEADQRAALRKGDDPRVKLIMNTTTEIPTDLWESTKVLINPCPCHGADRCALESTSASYLPPAIKALTEASQWNSTLLPQAGPRLSKSDTEELQEEGLLYIRTAAPTFSQIGTRNGLLGFTPGDAQKGDLLVHVPAVTRESWSARMLIVLRPMGDGLWRFRGLALVPEFQGLFVEGTDLQDLGRFADSKQEFTVI